MNFVVDDVPNEVRWTTERTIDSIRPTIADTGAASSLFSSLSSRPRATHREGEQMSEPFLVIVVEAAPGQRALSSYLFSF